MFSSLSRLAGGALRAGNALRGSGGHWLGERMVNTRGAYLTKPKALDVAGREFKEKHAKRRDKNFVEPERGWHVIDAHGQVMGRLASKIVPLLCGKHKPIYQAQRDVGDYVVVVNAAQVVLTGKKREQKRYYRHSGYPGGLKTITFEQMFEANPVRPLRQAIWGMMPRNKLKMQRMRRLRLFPGPEHVHESVLKDPSTKAFEVLLPPGDGQPKVLPLDKLPAGPD